MIISQCSEVYINVSDSDLLAEYVKQDKARLAAINVGDDFLADTLDAIIFQIDDELCARGLDLPL